MKLPTFLIAGAMKCATSSLHQILAHHPRVFIPKGEIHFFDIDDIQQHPDFFRRGRDGWSFHDYDAEFPLYLDWYRSFFAAAADDQFIGDDSATYLASTHAPARIANLLPEAKILVLLRDPVRRAYSHYWHLVQTGRATRSFENTIWQAPSTLLTQGMYRDQLANYLRHIPRDQIHVMLFEEFVATPQEQVDRVARFLDLPGTIDVQSMPTRYNASRIPRHLGLTLLANRLPGLGPRDYAATHLPHPGPAPARPRGRGLAARWRQWTLSTDKPAPPMRKDTQTFLESLYRKENRGLSGLIGIDLEAHWEWMRE